MIKKITTLALICLSLSIYSQSTKITWGPTQKDSKKVGVDKVITDDGKGGIYVLKSELNGKEPDQFIEHYNSKLELTKKAELSLKTGKYKQNVLDVIEHDNQLISYALYDDKKADNRPLTCQVIDKNSLDFSGNSKVIFKSDYSEEKKQSDAEIAIAYSPDSSIIMSHTSLEDKKKENDRFDVNVFTTKGTMKWNKRITLPYPSKQFVVMDYQVNNKGEVYVLGRHFLTNSTKIERNGTSNCEYILLSYTQNGKTEKERVIQLKDKFITDMDLIISKEGHPLCAGFYSSETGKNSNVGGIYYLKLDQYKDKVISTNTKDFDIDFLTSEVRKKEAKKAKKKDAKGKNVEFYELHIDHVIPRGDGGAVILAEQRFVNIVTHTYTDANGGTRTSTTYHYHNRDIVVVSIKPSGEIEWTEKINKEQHTTNDGAKWNSYAFMIQGSKIHFIYNDHVDNIGDAKNGNISVFTKKKKQSVTVLETLTFNGKSSKKQLFDFKEAESLCVPTLSKKVSNDELIIFFTKGSKERFAKVKLD